MSVSRWETQKQTYLNEVPPHHVEQSDFHLHWMEIHVRLNLEISHCLKFDDVRVMTMYLSRNVKGCAILKLDAASDIQIQFISFKVSTAKSYIFKLLAVHNIGPTTY